MAKFKVGDRVRLVKRVEQSEGTVPLGAEGVVVEGFFNLDDDRCWVSFPGHPLPSNGLPYWAPSNCQLEPITDTWAQDKVAQLVKQCMPVAA